MRLFLLPTAANQERRSEKGKKTQEGAEQKENAMGLAQTISRLGRQPENLCLSGKLDRTRCSPAEFVLDTAA